MNIRRLLPTILIAAAMLASLSSCKKDPPPLPPPGPTEQTLFVYMPWSGDLTNFFRKNLEDLESAIKAGILENKNRVIVFFMENDRSATMFELVYDGAECIRKEVKIYNDPAFTTAEGITSILEDVKRFAPAPTYSMIVSAHGLGWVPVQATVPSASGAGEAIDMPQTHWEVDGEAVTRYFGGTMKQWQTDITTLAKAIADAGVRMEYILFDDCFMSGVEVAYDLREVTDYVIGCPTEIMGYGMPYHIIGKHLVGDIDYRAICDDFIMFYTTLYEGQQKCGTIGITDCSEIDDLAVVMKEINSRFAFDDSLTNSLQTMCGYSPPLFFDCGDYVDNLCKDDALLQRFHEQLERTIPYKGHTEYYYSNMKGQVHIAAYSGTTISDPSQHIWGKAKTTTAWYKATH